MQTSRNQSRGLKITDLAELTELATKFPSGRFDDVFIQGYEPYISVDLRTFGVSAYISADTVEQRGVIARISDVVSRGKKRSPYRLYVVLVSLAMLVGIWQVFAKEYVLGTALVVLSFVSIPFAVRCGMKNEVIIHSETKGATKSFLERKKDDIALAVIAAFIGGAVTYLFTKFLI